jgi:hypothetical protein
LAKSLKKRPFLAAILPSRKQEVDKLAAKSAFVGCAWGRAAVMAEGYWGVIDELGNQIVPRQYDEIRPFHDGLAVVGRDGRYGYIDRDGHEVVERQFTYTTGLSDGMGLKILAWSFVPTFISVANPSRNNL